MYMFVLILLLHNQFSCINCIAVIIMIIIIWFFYFYLYICYPYVLSLSTCGYLIVESTGRQRLRFYLTTVSSSFSTIFVRCVILAPNIPTVYCLCSAGLCVSVCVCVRVFCYFTLTPGLQLKSEDNMQRSIAWVEQLLANSRCLASWLARWRLTVCVLLAWSETSCVRGLLNLLHCVLACDV